MDAVSDRVSNAPLDGVSKARIRDINEDLSNRLADVTRKVDLILDLVVRIAEFGPDAERFEIADTCCRLTVGDTQVRLVDITDDDELPADVRVIGIAWDQVESPPLARSIHSSSIPRHPVRRST